MQLHLGRSDFATQAQAQSFYLANDPANDPHRLDDDDNVVKRVRLLGIDTPERSRCGYRRATDSMRTLTPVGTSVTLVSDPSQDLRDRYGRLLGYVMRNRDGRDMNLVQLARGMARVYVYANDPFRRVGSYRDAVYAARTHDRGLWASCW